MVITKAMLEALRAERARPALGLDYSIGGPIETQVVSSLEKSREKMISRVERTLRTMHEEMQTQQTFASRTGLAKAHFNHTHSNHTVEEISP